MGLNPVRGLVQWALHTHMVETITHSHRVEVDPSWHSTGVGGQDLVVRLLGVVRETELTHLHFCVTESTMGDPCISHPAQRLHHLFHRPLILNIHHYILDKSSVEDVLTPPVSVSGINVLEER